MKFVKEDEKARRLRICRSCPDLIRVTMTCKNCGCFMKIKTTLETAKCPKGKW